MIWKWLIIDGWKSHAVPEFLEHALVADLKARPESKGEELAVESKNTTSMSIDMPGVVAMDRPWTTVVLDGLSIEFPCEDVAEFILQLDNLKPRTFKEAGLSYYKLHGFARCIVLTPDQRYLLTEALKEKLLEAEAQATAFYADRPTPSEALRKANAKAHGLDEDAYKDINFGANRQDRFRLGKKGDA